MTRVQEKGDSTLAPGITGPSVEVTGAKIQQAAFQQGHKEPPTPSPPRAIASLSVRVLAQPPAVPRTNEEGAAPTEPGSAHPVLHLSRSAGGRAHEDSDAEDSDDAESEDDEDWGPGPGGAPRANRAPLQPQQMPPSMPSTFARSKRKLQPPQHIPPPQAHHAPVQLRHPTPPPSPPPNLFPLPDTPKQSPPDTAEQEGEGAGARGSRGVPFAPLSMQNKDSDSSSCSSSPEPPAKRKPGPLSLLVQKMESEGAFHAGEESRGGPASSCKSPPHMPEGRSQQENKGVEELKHRNKKDREQDKIEEQEADKKSPREDTEEERKQPEEEKLQKEEKPQDEPKRREGKHQKQTEEPKSGEKKARGDSQDSDSSSDSDSKSDSSSGSSSSSSSSEDKSKVSSQMCD